MEIRLGLILTIWLRGTAFGEAGLIVATSKAGLSEADSRGTADGTVCRAFTLTTKRQAARIVTVALTRLNGRNIRLDPHNSIFSGGLHRTFFLVIAAHPKHRWIGLSMT
jgi:hypothetical protein